ncbi:GSCOCG00010292001-RA-CDS [Cotesia congregata]|nr:GSCOCG00010292001-RA-CDS [Cotesia congregata]
MKVIILLACVVVVLAEPPVRNTYYFAKQEEAPYPASGWKPEGAAFDLPQKQVQPAKQYGAPAAPQNQYGAPAAPQDQYGAPERQVTLKNPSTQPQRQYGAPQNQYGAPAAPQNHYGTPAVPENQYGTPTPAPQDHYGAPGLPQNQYGTPQYPSESSTVPDYDETTFPTTESQVSNKLIDNPTAYQAEPVESVNELDDVGNVDEQKQGEYFIALPDGRLQRVQYVSRQDLEAMKYFAKIQAENVEPLRGPIYAYQPLQKLQFAPTNLEVQGVAAKIQVPVAAKVTPAEEVAVPVASFSSFNYPEQRFLINF